MKKLLYKVICLLILISCNTTENKPKNELKLQSSMAKNDSVYLDSNVINCLSIYIDENDHRIRDKEWLYYCVFYTYTDSSNYITIWYSYIFPEYVYECVDSNKYEFYHFEYNQRNIVLIDEISNEKFYPLESKNAAEMKRAKIYKGDIYDGPFNYSNYEIKHNDTGYALIPLEYTIVDFWACVDLENYFEEEIEF